MDGSSAPVDPLPDYKQSNNCGDDPLNGYGSKNLAAGENPNNHMFHSGPGSQPAEAWTVGSGGVNPSSFGYPYPPSPGMYDPTGQYPPVESYPPPPAYPPTNHCCHSSLQNQQQSSVVVINGNPHLIPQPVIPLPRFYYRHMIIACMVFWLCGVLFGLLAFVYAVIAYKYAVTNPRLSRIMGRVSVILSIVGVVLGTLILAIVVPVVLTLTPRSGSSGSKSHSRSSH